MYRATYAVGHTSVDRITGLGAALLACQAGAVLSHLSAAALWGLRDAWPTLIDVTVPCQKGRKLDGIRCRRCRYPDEDEVVIHEGIRCTSPSRTLVDLAGILGTPSLEEAIARAAVLKLLDLADLDRALARARGRRGIRALDGILVRWRTPDGSVPDLRSYFEAVVLPRVVQLGFDRPESNRRLVLDGETLEVDFLWRRERLALETDGQASHGTPPAFQRDRERDQILLANGYRVARVTWDQMRSDPQAVVGRIARALRQAPAPAVDPAVP